ncbi:MAG: imidazole glycerol phosphate synthase subunit HisH [Candidatus Melainabacteria bacterium]|nr:imidazole glycerol phosphate synthase subunit HisH [Candidatus Melainabacteria bacterium]
MNSSASSLLQVIDYGGGNLGSVCRCLNRLKIPYQLVGAEEQPALSDQLPVLLPGVGSFSGLMEKLAQRNLLEPLQSLLKAGVPYLGICVGLQILFEVSEESPGVAGLSILPGPVQKLKASKVPQIGWNYIEPCQMESPSGYVYFVNSYVAHPAEPQVLWYTAEYEQRFCAAIRHQNITAVQFHPEKSGVFGHQMVLDWWQSVC